MVPRPAGPVLTVTVRSLDALARDLLARPGSWRVHSAFAHAFNLVDGDGTLLGMVAPPAGNGPATLVLARQPECRYDALLAPGAPATVEGDRLVIGSRLVARTADAALWERPPIRLTLAREIVMARIGRLAALAIRLAPSDGLAPLLAEIGSLLAGGAAVTAPSSILVAMARSCIVALLSAIRADDVAAVHDAAAALSGLGPGLTPSGDDVLAGLVLGMLAGGRGLSAPARDAISRAVAGRTTDVAAARVKHAIAGRPDEPTHDLLTQILSGDGAGLQGAARTLLSVGHTSGADTLLGLLLGLRLPGCA